MKQNPDRPPSLRAAIASALIGVGVLSGCASATIDDAVPTAASGTSATALAEGPKDTGAYPNLNVKPQSAAPQFTPAEQTSETQALQAAQAAQAAQGTTTTTDPAVLRKLAQTHADDALKKIETEQ